jgi:hypothetical protein
MMPVECEFESEVLAAVLEARWPQGADDELKAHAAACSICSSVASIAAAIAESREELRSRAVIPDSGRVWWLALRRARLEAARIANRPLTAVRVIALVCVVYLLIGTGHRLWWSVIPDIGARLGTAFKLLAEHSGLALAMIAVLFLVPAVYFAMGRE